MGRSNEFLELYKQLEQVAISVYNMPADGSAISRLERLSQFAAEKRKIKYCREVRALLQHNPKINNEFPVEPSAAMINLIKDLLIKIERPPRCINNATLIGNILTADYDDKIIPIMKKMRERGFAHVPIIENGLVTGVFSENTIFSYMLDEKVMTIDEDMCVRHFINYLPFKSHNSIGFRFLKANSLIIDAEKMFINAFKGNRRIAMIFLTEHGLPHEKLLGILTPLDVLGV